MKPKPRVYIETSVISYLTARPSRDLITRGRQASAQAWWALHPEHYELLISSYVLEEISRGEARAAQKRMSVLAAANVITADRQQTEALASALIRARALPAKVWLDALHIAVCATAGVPLLLTWNFKHIANHQQLEKIMAICRASGFEPPKITTPDALLLLHQSFDD